MMLMMMASTSTSGSVQTHDHAQRNILVDQVELERLDVAFSFDEYSSQICFASFNGIIIQYGMIACGIR